MVFYGQAFVLSKSQFAEHFTVGFSQNWWVTLGATGSFVQRDQIADGLSVPKPGISTVVR